MNAPKWTEEKIPATKKMQTFFEKIDDWIQKKVEVGNADECTKVNWWEETCNL